MIVCDVCHSLDAKTFVVTGKIAAGGMAFEGSSGTFSVDMCRKCFDWFREKLQVKPDVQEPAQPADRTFIDDGVTPGATSMQRAEVLVKTGRLKREDVNYAEALIRFAMNDAKTDGIAEEKYRRTYYQDIVYAVCNELDRAGVTFVAGERHKTLCGTIESPSTMVQESMKKLVDAYLSGNIRVCGNVKPAAEQTR